jgi:PspAA-like protein
MIIRILTEGQFDVPDSEIDGLNVLDEKLEATIESGDEAAFRSALSDLLDKVREVGKEVAVDELVTSDLLLPYSDASLNEVRDLLSGDGLIPGRSEGTAPAEA